MMAVFSAEAAKTPAGTCTHQAQERLAPPHKEQGRLVPTALGGRDVLPPYSSSPAALSTSCLFQLVRHGLKCLIPVVPGIRPWTKNRNNPNMNPQISRRSFLKTSTGVVLSSQLGFNILHAQNKGDKLRLAIIATGGKGGAHLQCVQQAGDIVVAHCDIDTKRQGMTTGTWPGSKFYQDYRELFDKELKNFDAVMVATPDHSHYQPTALAMAAGKHCYTQKPLVHTVWEARQLNLGVQKHKVATQMGNQGHSGEGNRIIYEYVNGGFLGDVAEIHCVTNRPIWPQGGPRPVGEDPVPANVNWDLWLGPGPRPSIQERGLP